MIYPKSYEYTHISKYILTNGLQFIEKGVHCCESSSYCIQDLGSGVSQQCFVSGFIDFGSGSSILG